MKEKMMHLGKVIRAQARAFFTLKFDPPSGNLRVEKSFIKRRAMSQDAEKAKLLYDSHAEEYFRDISHNKKMQYLRRFIKRFFSQSKGKKILFAGCGDGAEAKAAIDAGAKIIGIDVSDKCIDLAKKKFPNEEFLVADFAKTTFANKSFDMIFSSLAVMYKKNLKGVLAEFNRVLRPEGEAIIVVPHPFYKAARYSNMDYFATGQMKEVWSGHERFNYYWTMEEYVNSLVFAGFSLERLYEPPVPKEFSPTPGHIPPFAILVARKKL